MDQLLAGCTVGLNVDGIVVQIDIVERPRGNLVLVAFLVAFNAVRRTHIDSELCTSIDRHLIGGAVRRGTHIDRDRFDGGEIACKAVAARPDRGIGKVFMSFINNQPTDRGIIDLRRDAESLKLVGIHTLEDTAPFGRLSGVLARYDLVVLKRVEGNQL